ncbi:Tetratricopeptide repeat protein [Posidoniimonas corsicana]|uniref:Tetratricopeptide repeat protein n=1 Tax=Posidoniimonas corsicana TaxID=1938618 RepID=A0A5C5VDY0_9BACT|nr:tetratricopeptide repeat protein [Posidoniimonas corsicana]TWT36818.1 Tetratricopeptide repeat protein [Posidoniimonas corsicana]
MRRIENETVGWARTRTRFAAGLLAWLLASGALAGRPFTPESDGQVLETLPKALLAEQGALTALRRRLSDDPSDRELAVEVAERYVSLGKQQSDPRYYGYAQAALAPWWSQEAPPPDVLLLRAKIKERDHRYDDAIADLRLLLEGAPRNVQAWVELTNLYRVQGRLDEARQACENLSGFADAASVMFCGVPVQAATGQAEEAYAALGRILPVARDRWTDALPWVLTMQAEVARALGKNDEAQRHYREGLELHPDDTYLLRAYADFLLDRGREDEVLPLLRDHTSDTGVLLRAAIAADRLGRADAARDWSGQLESRFEEIRLRGGEPHGRYESRYALELQKQPKQALGLALANWQKQREVRDSRNVLEAALAADDPSAASPVLAFLRRYNTQDVDLQRLVDQLEAAE